MEQKTIPWEVVVYSSKGDSMALQLLRWLHFPLSKQRVCRLIGELDEMVLREALSPLPRTETLNKIMISFPSQVNPS